MKKIGIAGTGRLGSALASRLVQAGYEVVLANRRGPGSLGNLIRELGPNAYAGTLETVAAQAVVVLAMRWEDMREAIAGLGTLAGRIVIDTTNPYMEKDGQLSLIDIGERTSSEIVASLIPDARLVKAFNTLAANTLAADPELAGGGRRVMFVSGDHVPSKELVKNIASTVGWVPLDLGGLVAGGQLQQAGGPLAGIDLIRVA